MSKSAKVTLVIFLVLLADQWLKVWVKTNMSYGEEFKLLGLDWARIHFVENKGMAFGKELTFLGEYGKLVLSVFRILAAGALVYYLRLLIKAQVNMGLLIAFGLILAGALGNIIDSAVYGLIFSESYHGEIAQAFPADGGYAGFLYGRVVDMFYFPMFRGSFPDWLPIWGGQSYLFFRPVFNIADVAITTGVFSLLIWQRSFFKDQPAKEDAPAEVVNPTQVGVESLPGATMMSDSENMPADEEE